MMKTYLMLLLPIFYLTGMADTLYYFLERGYLPEKFWNVWIWTFEPTTNYVVNLNLFGLTVFGMIIIFWKDHYGNSPIEKIIDELRLWDYRRRMKKSNSWSI